MNLILMRHGDAIDEQTDPKRPLTVQGRHDVRESATFITKEMVSNHYKIIHGPKLRAKETALIIHNKLKNSNISENKEMLPSSSANKWFTRLSKESEDILIVGHLPFLDDLCNLLSTQKKIDHFHTASVKIFSFKDSVWKMDKSFDP